MQRAIAATVVVAVAGCSTLVMDQVSDDWQPSQQPRCTSSRVAPAVDTLFALLDGSGAIYGFEHGDSEQGTLSLLSSALWLSSALLGYGWASDCRKAQREYDAYGGTGGLGGDLGAAREELREMNAAKRARESKPHKRVMVGTQVDRFSGAKVLTWQYTPRKAEHPLLTVTYSEAAPERIVFTWRVPGTIGGDMMAWLLVDGRRAGTPVVADGGAAVAQFDIRDLRALFASASGPVEFRVGAHTGRIRGSTRDSLAKFIADVVTRWCAGHTCAPPAPDGGTLDAGPALDGGPDAGVPAP